MWVIFGLVGLFMILRELFPWLKAQKTGQIRKRGHGRKLVLRAEEPERFKGLMRNHTDGMIIGLLAIGMGIAWTFIGLFALVLIIPIGAVMTAQSRRSKIKFTDDAPAQPYEGRL